MKCSECGVCCKLFLINLTEEEYKSGRYKTMFDEFVHDFSEAEMVGANILAQKEDKSCVYLKDKKCSIHNFRPQVCRDFFCDTEDKKFKEMIEKIKEFKDN
ncbi:YkgJ family cysteine cluster protein [Candidatus Woesearchaeota archaeon]|nr:YkgJ family cysteine cluster protein [Candidatus Woesearchaeota archaeon]